MFFNFNTELLYKIMDDILCFCLSLQVPVINSSKIRHYNAWFKDLASHKGLTQLCKNKVPVFNKKEDIFQVLSTVRDDSVWEDYLA